MIYQGKFADRVEYEQWIVRLRLERQEAAEIEARKCACHLCKELWNHETRNTSR